MRPVIDAILALPPFRRHECQGCGGVTDVHVLQMDVNCSGCGVHQKCRGFGEIGSEVPDVIDAVLQWAGVTREEVRQRHEANAAKRQADGDGSGNA